MVTPKLVTLKALDYDMHVALQCDIPASTDKSFVRKNVYYTVSDSVFQSSSLFHDGVLLCKIIKGLKYVPPVLMKYMYGETDQSNTLVSVKVTCTYLL